MQKNLQSLGKLLFVGVLGALVLKKYREIFALSPGQSIILVIFFIIMVFAADRVSGWLGKYLSWKESLVEWLTIGLLFVILGTVYTFFIL